MTTNFKCFSSSRLPHRKQNNRSASNSWLLNNNSANSIPFWTNRMASRSALLVSKSRKARPRRMPQVLREAITKMMQRRESWWARSEMWWILYSSLVKVSSTSKTVWWCRCGHHPCNQVLFKVPRCKLSKPRVWTQTKLGGAESWPLLPKATRHLMDSIVTIQRFSKNPTLQFSRSSKYNALPSRL